MFALASAFFVSGGFLPGGCLWGAARAQDALPASPPAQPASDVFSDEAGGEEPSSDEGSQSETGRDVHAGQGGGHEPSPVLTLDQDKLYSQSKFGERVRRRVAQMSDSLRKENRVIEASLEMEETRLTNERADMEPARFQALAADFDERVTEIRNAQAAKMEEIRRIAEQERARFFQLAFPELLKLVEESGAVAILDDASVIFSVRQIDITDAAIARVNAAVGASETPIDPETIPRPRPEDGADVFEGIDLFEDEPLLSKP